MSRPLPAYLLAAGLFASPVVAVNATPHTGFPKVIASGGIVRFGKPLVVDLDGTNGPKEIVVATCVNTVTSNADCDGGRKLYVLDNNGNVFTPPSGPGWPQSLTAEPYSGAAAGNLDGTGALEIVIGAGSGVPGEGNGRVTAFHKDGSVMWSFSPINTGTDGLPDGVASTPATGDLNGDGRDDGVFGSFGFNVHALSGTNGRALPG